jgi:hypothetical protein
LRVVTEKVQAWGELHNLIEDSQVNSTKVTSLRQTPQQLDAGKFHQSYKSNWGNERERIKEEINKILQDIDLTSSLTKTRFGLVK